jgi:hypothetical protein
VVVVFVKLLSPTNWSARDIAAKRGSFPSLYSPTKRVPVSVSIFPSTNGIGMDCYQGQGTGSSPVLLKASLNLAISSLASKCFGCAKPEAETLSGNRYDSMTFAHAPGTRTTVTCFLFGAPQCDWQNPELQACLIET